jgi:hypothetical protein
MTLPPDKLPGSAPTEATWAVHRQDDIGNRFVVETGLTRDAADQLALQLESRGHKQLYWVEADSD